MLHHSDEEALWKMRTLMTSGSRIEIYRNISLAPQYKSGCKCSCRQEAMTQPLFVPDCSFRRFHVLTGSSF